jgi:hypothetical protein
MTNITNYDDSEDDGFQGSITGGRLIKGTLLRWNETNDWMDRDGLRPPEILLVLALTEAFQRWKNKKVIDEIMIKPLPDLETLNSSISVSEWELGLDNRPKPPYAHQKIVYLIDPATAGFFTYINSTFGARICWDNLRERVITMRTLRGQRVVPLVKLSHRPMKTAFGMKHRPEFEIVGWRNLGGKDAIGSSTSPQISGPKPTAEIKPAAKIKPIAAEPKPTAAAKPAPASTATASPAPSSTASAADATLAAMGQVSIPSVAEELADEIPW